MLKTPLGRFRVMLWIQSIIYALLLFVGLPLKHVAGMPQAVTLLGNIYGLSFLLLLIALIYVRTALDWSLRRPLIIFFVSFIPFGLMVMDLIWIKKWDDTSIAKRHRTV